MTLETPLGRHGYTWELTGTCDVPTLGPGWAILASSDLFRERYGRDWIYVWRRRVYCHEAQGWLEIRWHPLTGLSAPEAFYAAVGVPVARAKAATTALYAGETLLHAVTRPGRPPLDYELCCQEVEAARRYYTSKEHDHPTHAELAWKMGLTKRAFQGRCRKFKAQSLPYPPP